LGAVRSFDFAGKYYQVQGLRSLLDDSRTPSDAFLRWTGEYYILRGQNPYDVYFAQRYAEGPEAYERVVGRNSRTDPKVGVAWDVGYPPWSFAPHAILYWPPWSVVRLYLVFWYIIATSFTAVWAYKVGGGSRCGIRFALSWLACSSHTVVYSIGQSATFVVASLAACHWLEELGRPLASGVALGLSLSKHTFSRPFRLCFITSRGWKTLGTCIAYIALVCCIVWVATATEPIEMSGQMFQGAAKYVASGTGPMSLMIRAGLPPHPHNVRPRPGVHGCHHGNTLGPQESFTSRAIRRRSSMRADLDLSLVT
jgi:hypothetical protein